MATTKKSKQFVSKISVFCTLKSQNESYKYKLGAAKQPNSTCLIITGWINLTYLGVSYLFLWTNITIMPSSMIISSNNRWQFWSSFTKIRPIKRSSSLKIYVFFHKNKKIIISYLWSIGKRCLLCLNDIRIYLFLS